MVHLISKQQQLPEAQATGDSTALNGGDVLTITAVDGGVAEGAAGNGIGLTFVDSNDSGGAVNSVTFDGTTITVTADLTSGVGSDDIATAITAFNGGADLLVASDGTANVVAADVGTEATITAGGLDAVAAVDAAITIAASADGASFNRTIAFTSNTDVGAGLVTATDDGTTLTINVDDDTDVDLTAVVTAIEGVIGTTDFTTTLADNAGDGQFNTTVDHRPNTNKRWCSNRWCDCWWWFDGCCGY